jgi:hypothetical protein
MEKVKCSVKINVGGTIFNVTRQFILYADDEVVPRCAVKHVAETVEDMTTVTSQISLIIIYPKCMITGIKNGDEPEDFAINGQRYENVEMSRYLGAVIRDTNETETGIKVKIVAGNKCCHIVGHVLKERYITNIKNGSL